MKTSKIIARPILQNKFWILEDKGEKVGTISVNDEQYLFSGNAGTEIFTSLKSLQKKFNIEFSSTEQPVDNAMEKIVYGYPTSCMPFNTMYDVKRKLPLFTKSSRSKSLYCAGYYIIHFDKGWVKSFCPKLITVERYETQGPFKTELEMRTELSRVNAK